MDFETSGQIGRARACAADVYGAPYQILVAVRQIVPARIIEPLIAKNVTRVDLLVYPSSLKLRRRTRERMKVVYDGAESNHLGQKLSATGTK
jgi:hypothetical protein